MQPYHAAQVPGTIYSWLAAFGIVTHNDKVLLVKIAEPFREAHKWNFPGGVIEMGEHIEEGLVREILEETNTTIEIGSLVDVFTTVEPENTIHIYEATYLSGELVFQEVELEDAGWFTIKQALDLPLAFTIRNYLIQR